MSSQPFTRTLKEIDQECGATKGTAFLAFKKLKPSLQEGRDFYCISQQEQPEALEQLRQSGRVYGSTLNALLFFDSGYQAIMGLLNSKPV